MHARHWSEIWRRGEASSVLAAAHAHDCPHMRRALTLATFIPRRYFGFGEPSVECCAFSFSRAFAFLSFNADFEKLPGEKMSLASRRRWAISASSSFSFAESLCFYTTNAKTLQ
jgi:hypothetical protein